MPERVALETTLLIHGVPHAESRRLCAELMEIVSSEGVTPALIGVLHGTPRTDLGLEDLEAMLRTPEVPKINTSNLGIHLHRGGCGATTVSATVEIAAGAGIRIFATGGIGGVHPGLSERLDISADLAAIARHPVAVVTSGVKSLLDIASTRELLETLGVPVIGFRTDRFPAFFSRAAPDADVGVDGRIDDESELCALVHAELKRTRRGVIIANPVPSEEALEPDETASLIAEATALAGAEGVHGRAVTPFVLARLNELSGGRTLRANIALVRSNARLAAQLARHLERQ